MLVGLDPGDSQSAILWWNDEQCRVEHHEKSPNLKILELVRSIRKDTLVIEMVESFGMPVGKTIFETVMWIGRFMEACGQDHRISRREVKLHFCNTARAKDSNVRAALIEHFGGRSVAIGTKKNPGALYGIHDDEWSALAIALTWRDKQSCTK